LKGEFGRVGCPNWGTLDGGLDGYALSAILGAWSLGSTGFRGAFTGDRSLTILIRRGAETVYSSSDTPNTKGIGDLECAALIPSVKSNDGGGGVLENRELESPMSLKRSKT